MAAEQAGEWLSQLLQDLSAQDIQQAASQLAETAVSTIEMFQQNISHGLLEWADAQQAPRHLSAFLGGLGLEPHQHDSVVKAVVYSVYERSSDGVKQEQLANLTEVCVAGPCITTFQMFTLCTMLCLLCALQHDGQSSAKSNVWLQGIGERLKADEQELESDVLRAAAILEKRHIYVFD